MYIYTVSRFSLGEARVSYSLLCRVRQSGSPHTIVSGHLWLKVLRMLNWVFLKKLKFLKAELKNIAGNTMFYIV